VRLDPAHLLRATKAVVAGVGVTGVSHWFPWEVLPSTLEGRSGHGIYGRHQILSLMIFGINRLVGREPIFYDLTTRF